MAKSASIGLIETFGVPTAIAAADAAVKSANVELLGYELTKGDGLVTIKLAGNVDAVNAAVEAGSKAGEMVGRVFSKHVIPRPSNELDKMISQRIGKRLEKPIADSNKEEQEQQITENEGVIEKGLDIASNSLVDSHLEISTEDIQVNVADENGEVKEAVEMNQNDGGLCNLCYDPSCTRKKGELKSLCVQYKGGK